MLIVVILIAVSLVIALIFLGVFFWNIRSGQYEDLYTPSIRMLFEDEVNIGEERENIGTSGDN